MSSTEQQAPGIRRTDRQRHDLGVPGREAPFVKRKHPGGRWSTTSTVRGQRLARPVTTCSSLDETVHAVRCGHSGALQLLELGYTGQLAERPRPAACERTRLHVELPARGGTLAL